jgi:tetratricopeptide (TPR) repeat protein
MRRSVVALAAIAWAALLVPVAVRNARMGGGFTLTTNGGVNFYAGNAPGANGRFHEPEGVHFFTAPVLTDATAIPTAIVARALTVRSAAGTEQAANSALWMARARAWMRSEPAAAAALPFRKAWLLLQAQEIPQVESYAFQARRLAALRWMAVDFGWLWPFAALGAWRTWRRRETRMVAVWAAALLAPSVIFFVTARHRLIAAPEVALLCGAGVATLWDAARRRAWRSVAGALMLVTPVAVAARAGARPPQSARGWEHAQMAERLYVSDDLPGAIREQEIAARILPDRIEAQLNLASYWSESHNAGDAARALALSQDIVRRWPENALARYNLGEQLWSHGRFGEAVASWSCALTLDPSFERARVRLEESRSGGEVRPPPAPHR